MKQLSTDQIKRLNDPLPPEAVKPHPTKTFLSTIKAIYVVERLNEVFGLGGWFINNVFVERAEKWVVIKSTFQAPEYGITIPDVFGGNDNADLGDAYKGACTDALTKIGSYLGIGMDIFKGLGDKKDKPTTAYNHKELSVGGKPLITNGAFKKACDRIRAGEVGVYEKVIDMYSLEGTQKQLLESLNNKKNGQPA
jgi:hypothetical protein